MDPHRTYEGMSLRDVYLSHCKVLSVKPNSVILKELSTDVDAQPDAMSIDVSKNYLGNRGVLAFLEVLNLTKSLQSLNISNNGIMNDTIVSLCRCMLHHPNLKSINLKNNPISLVSAVALLDLVRRNPSVSTVNIDGTLIEDRAKLRLAKTIERNARLAKRVTKDETPFQKIEKEYSERRRQHENRSILHDPMENNGEDIMMLLRSSIPRPPQRSSSGWVVLNVFISSTSSDFKTELRSIHENIIPSLNKMLTHIKVHLHPVSVYYNENSKLEEPNHSVSTHLSERLWLIDICSPVFTALLGDRHGPVPGYIPPSHETSPCLVDVRNKEALPIAILEAQYGGLCNPSSASLYFVRQGSRCLNPPQGIIEALSDDYSYINTDPEGKYSLANPVNEQANDPNETPDVKKTRWEMWKDLKKTILGEPGPMVLRKYKSRFTKVTPEGDIMLADQEEFNEAYKTRLLAVVTYLYNDAINEGQQEISVKKWKEHPQYEQETTQYIYGVSPLLGRKNAISKLELYVVSPASRNILLLRGPRGCGMSSVMAIFIQRCVKKESSTLVHFVVGHAGLSTECCDLRTLLLSLCRNMTGQDLPLHIQNEVNIRIIKEYFRSVLGETASSLKDGHLLVIAIDGLDKLVPTITPPADVLMTNTGRNILEAEEQSLSASKKDGLDWIPMCLPKNVRLLVSCSNESPYVAWLMARGQDSCEDVTVSSPGTADVEHVIAEKLAAAKVTLNKVLIDDILAKPDIRCPLYTKLIVDKIIQRWERGYPSAPRPFVQSLPDTVDSLVENMLDYAEECAGKELVRDTLCFLALMTEGLLLMQLREILANKGKTVSYLSGKKLAALMHGIRPFLVDIIGQPPWNGTAIKLQISSSVVKDALLARYAPTEEGKMAFYAKITTYMYRQSELEDHPLTADSLRTYPCAMIKARQWSSIVSSIFSVRTVRRSFYHHVGYVFFREMLHAATALWEASDGGTTGVGVYAPDEVKGWLHKMKEYIHFVHANLSSLSSRPLLSIQQALQCPDESNVYIEARKHFELHPNESHFICTNKKALKLHKGLVSSSVFSKNGLRVLSSASRSFTLSNVIGDVIHQIVLNSPIIRAMVSATSRYVLVVLGDKTMSLYDAVTGTSVSKLSGHTGRIRCVDMSCRSRYVLSGSDDGTLKIWNTETGKCVADLAHNMFCASSSAFTAVSSCTGHPSDESLLLSAVDRVALMWKRQGSGYELIHRLTAHTTCPVKSVRYLQNGELIMTCVRKPAAGAGGEAGPTTTPLQDTAIKVFNATTGELKTRVHGTDHSGIVSLAVCPNEMLLGAALEDGSVVYWETRYDTVDLYPVKTIKAYKESALLVAFCILQETRVEPEDSNVPPEHTNYLAVTIGDSDMLNAYYTSDWSPAAEYVFHTKVQTLDCTTMPTSDGAEIAVGDSAGRVYLLKSNRLNRTHQA